MSLKTDILTQLKRRGTLSGQALAEMFGVTRAAVWKAVSALRKEGYRIEGAPKAGYRLLLSDVADGDELSRLLSEAGFPGVKIYVVSALPSTNAYAERLLAEGETAPSLVLAERQTAGRARRGKAFPSETGGVYMSLLLFPRAPAREADALSEKIYGAVRSVLGGTLRDNEIFSDGTKLCGVLVEYLSDPDGIAAVSRASAYTRNTFLPRPGGAFPPAFPSVRRSRPPYCPPFPRPSEKRRKDASALFGPHMFRH